MPDTPMTGLSIGPLVHGCLPRFLNIKPQLFAQPFVDYQGYRPGIYHSPHGCFPDFFLRDKLIPGIAYITGVL